MKLARWSAVVLTVFAGCGTTDIAGDGGRLRFWLGEGYFVNSPPPPQIALIVESEVGYGCANYHLDGRFDAADRVLRVELTGTVSIGQICLTALGPAQFRTALPVTSGAYNLEFTRFGVTDRYRLDVSAAALEITPLEAPHFTTPKARRFPRAL